MMETVGCARAPPPLAAPVRNRHGSPHAKLAEARSALVEYERRGGSATESKELDVGSAGHMQGIRRGIAK
jgi:hypothetical protein